MNCVLRWDVGAAHGDHRQGAQGPLHKPESSQLFSIKIKKNNNIPSELNIHSIIAGQKGIKIDSQFIPIMIR